MTNESCRRKLARSILSDAHPLRSRGLSRLLRVLLFVPLTACGQEKATLAIDEAVPPPPTEAELTAAMFPTDRLLEISIDLAEDDWQALTKQTRSFFDVIGATCLAPRDSPFTYFPASFTVDGQTIAQVGVRKKGFFGSLDTVKPSLVVDFEEYVDGQRISGMKRLTLNNNKSDPSHVKQCLGYALFNRAGVKAPRCAFAKVVVNGRNLGFYTHVEAVKKQFLRLNFSDDSGNLYEGALSDFRDGWIDTFELKTNETADDRSDIEALVPIMQLGDQGLLAGLAPYIDADQFITFWAMELLVAHADGYARNSNNFYLYHDPTTGRFTFIPWGIDAILFPAELKAPWEPQAPPSTIWAVSALPRRLYNLPQERTIYFARLRELLDSVWIEDDLVAELDRMERLLSPEVDAVKQDEFAVEVQKVRDFVLGRRAFLEAELARPEPVLSGPLRDAWCVDPLGDVTGSVTTTWDNLTAPDIFVSGSGALAGTYKGASLPISVAVGARSGIDIPSGQAQIQLAGSNGTNRVTLIIINIQPELFVGGTSVPIDWVAASGYAVDLLFTGAPEPQMTVLGILGDGAITLDAASLVTGAAVRGTLSTKIYEAPAMLGGGG
jgi:spore coat protein CotH